MNKIKNAPYRIKTAVLCVAAVVFGAVTAAVRTLILFGGEGTPVSLYPNGGLTDVFAVLLLLFSVMLCLGVCIFNGESKRLTPNKGNGAMVFSGTLLGFCFLALALSVFFSAKLNETPLTMLDAVLTVLSLISSVSFFSDAFAKEQLSEEASIVMMLSRPICCLFITFYFYFNSSTVIHDSNKKTATLAFVFMLLSFMYGIKYHTGKPKTKSYISFTLLAVFYTIVYSLPNLVWFFAAGESLLRSVFFDLLPLAFCVYSAASLLSLRAYRHSGKHAVRRVEELSHFEQSEILISDTEPAKASDTQHMSDDTDGTQTADTAEPDAVNAAEPDEK